MLLPVHLGLLVCVLATVQADCPGAPWKEWKGHCYRLSASPVSWHGIRADCKSSFRQADVASITSKAEHDFIVYELSGDEKLWLGMRSHKERLWWVDNSTVTFTNFDKRAPRTKEANDVVLLNGDTRYWELVSSYENGIKLRGLCKMASCDCPTGWKKESNRCYKAEKRRKIGWMEARQQCQRMAPTADLVTIRSATENNFVFGLAAGQYPSWIGLNDREQEGMYRWSGGGNLSSYDNWHRPTSLGIIRNEHCAVIREDQTWADTKCGTTNFRNGFVCEQQMCGRDKPIRSEPARGGRLRVWRPEDGVRCPDGWSRSGDKCFSKPTAADTFSGVQSLCTRQHPKAGIAIVSSLEDNDRAYHAANTLPVWIGHDVHFTNWQQDDAGSAECASMQTSGQWLSESCVKVQPGLCQVPACVSKCPSVWSVFEDHCYRVDDTKRSLVDARAACQSAGGHLASIQSQEENDFITTLAFPSSRFQEFLKDWIAGFALFGASPADNGSVWSWNDCTDWTISRWHGNNGQMIGARTCTILLKTGRWQFGDCTGQSLRSVCKLDPCRKQFGALDRTGCSSVEGTTTTPSPTTIQHKPVKFTTTPSPAALTTDHISVNQHSTVQPNGCPDDGKLWSEEDDVCRTVSLSKPTYFRGAFQTCKNSSKNGFKVTVPVIKLANRKAALMKLADGRDVWLGLTRRRVGYWYWHDATRAGSLGWQVKPGRRTRCVSMDGKTGGLVARDCSDKLPFFCEAKRIM